MKEISRLGMQCPSLWNRGTGLWLMRAGSNTHTFRSDFISPERILADSFRVSSKLLWKTVNIREQGGFV